ASKKALAARLGELGRGSKSAGGIFTINVPLTLTSIPALLYVCAALPGLQD
ncbi:unnamed protein product, partial [marine sediment metagenome]